MAGVIAVGGGSPSSRPTRRAIVEQELGFSSPVGINVKMLMDSAQLQSPEEDAPAVITAFVHTYSIYVYSLECIRNFGRLCTDLSFSFLPPPRSSEQKQSLLMWIHHQDGLVYFQGCDSTFLLPSAE